VLFYEEQHRARQITWTAEQQTGRAVEEKIQQAKILDLDKPGMNDQVDC